MSILSSILIDLVYLIAAVVSSPVWLYRMVKTGKIRTDWPGRFGRVPDPLAARRAPGPQSRRTLLVHAVSVGEVNAVRSLVDRLHHEYDVVIASTTNTGFARATELFGDQHRVVRSPLDFSLALRRFLQAIRPDAVILVELEVWPNFMLITHRWNIPVIVVNGRLSEHSYRGYRRVRVVIAPFFRRLSAVAAQDEAIAERFRALGAPHDAVRVIPTMKWDNAEIVDDIAGSKSIVEAFHLDRSKPVIVAGSTADGEEALIHRAVPEDVQLIVAPRKPERFDEAAAALPGCVRRSARLGRERSGPNENSKRFLLDSIGELRAAYALADLVIVGRTFTPLGGSDMIEPISLGKPTIVGFSTSNFESVMHSLRKGQGIVECSAEELADAVHRLLNDPHERRRLAERGRAIIRKNQGSVVRHEAMIREIVPAGRIEQGCTQ